MPVLVCLVVVAFAQAYAKPSVKKVSGYTITSTPRPADRYDRQASVVVKDGDGKVVLTVKDWAATLEWVDDLEGAGIKVAAISAYSGGAHCCETDYFLRLGPKPKLLGRYEMGNVSGLQVQRTLDSKRKHILTGYDGFAYFHSSYAGSARLPLALKVHDGRIVDATKEFPALLKSTYKSSCEQILSNTSAYEQSLVKKESQGEGLFGNDLGGPVIEAYALSLLLGTEKPTLQYLSSILYREDFAMLESLESEIAKVLAVRAGRLTYPGLPYVHDGDAH